MKNNEDNKNLANIKLFRKKVLKNILDMSLVAGANSSHFGGALSIVDIISTLFAYKLSFNKNEFKNTDRDKFILSKGHACLAYYSALVELGFISTDEIKTFEKDNSNLLGHPVRNLDIGIEFSNGSLGMGLSIGVGLAIALKKKSKKNKVYVILGDGECNEGSVWEAAMAAPNFKLDNLHVIIDKNNFQQTGSNESIMDLKNLAQKWKAFEWQTDEVNGHNLNDIYNYFKNLSSKNKPTLLIANTIKGKGFSFSENNNNWHHAVLTQDLYKKALGELDINS